MIEGETQEKGTAHEQTTAASKKQADVGRYRNLTNAGKGRRPGVPNIVTRELKAAIASFLENNVDELQTLFDRVKVKSPARAITLFVALAEFVLPKQRHNEISAQVTSVTFDANRPIDNVAAAEAAYKAMLGDPDFDFDKVRFAVPAAPEALPVPIAAAAQPVEASAPVQTAAEPMPPDPTARPVDEEQQQLWARLAE